MKEICLIIISVLISVSITLFLTKQSTKIAVIDQDEVFKKLVTEINEETRADNEEILMKKLKKYQNIKSIMDKKMAKIAEEKNFIILPKQDVIGGEDLTDQAKLLLSDLVKEMRLDVEK